MANPFFSESELDLRLALEGAGITEEESEPEDENGEEDEEFYDFLCNECGHTFDGADEVDLGEDPMCPECGSTDVEPS